MLFVLFASTSKIQQNIRQAQIQELMPLTVKTTKIHYANYELVNNLIKNKKTVTILFSDPKTSNYDKIMAIFNDKKQIKAFNHRIYICPIVYQKKEIIEKYQLKHNESIAVFYENGQQKNSLSIDESIDLNMALIPELNLLPMTGDSLKN
ncbi:hypothetical protein QQF92_04670 [Melissococcus plutonius]